MAEESTKPKLPSKSKEEWERFVIEENDKIREKYLAEGDQVYELYAIMVHSGGANAGHYFAYIKDVDTQQWLKFNDSQVHRVSVIEVMSTFGVPTKTKAKTRYDPSGRVNAYMLWYRRLDEDNISIVPDSMISQDLFTKIGEENEKEEMKQAEHERNS